MKPKVEVAEPKPVKAAKPTLELARDDSGHWYVIPTSKRAAWIKFLDSGKDDVPSWATETGGSYNRVKFLKYTLD